MSRCPPPADGAPPAPEPSGAPSLLSWEPDSVGVGGRWMPVADREPDPDDARYPVEVIDSWLVVDGAVRGLEHHLARFAASVTSVTSALVPAGPDEPAGDVAGQLAAALSALPAALATGLPRAGRWFPRLELAHAASVPRRSRLALRLRPAPALGGALTVTTAVDTRLRPRDKGPDLDLLARVHARGVAAGADEVLLTTAEGIALEGTRTALVWFAEGALWLPDASLPVLPSVTARLLESLAAAQGTPVRRGRIPVAALREHETWLVNALHGLRPVHRWLDPDGSLVPAAPTGRAARWQEALTALARPLPEPTR